MEIGSCFEGGRGVSVVGTRDLNQRRKPHACPPTKEGSPGPVSRLELRNRRDKGGLRQTPGIENSKEARGPISVLFCEGGKKKRFRHVFCTSGRGTQTGGQEGHETEETL